jgi:hypothetical protein
VTAALTPEMQGLKRATAALVKAGGGVEAAALLCRLGKSQLACAGSVNEADRFLPADAILDLESCTRGLPGWPQITGFLARQHGLALVDLSVAEDGGGPVDWLQHIAALSKEAGDVVSKIAANAAGGLSAAEVAGSELERECDELIDAAVKLRAAVRAVVREGK